MIAYVLLGVVIGIGVMLVAIVCYKNICIGYTEEAEPRIREISTHKILKVWKEKDEEKWCVICKKFAYYTLPLTTDVNYVKEDGDMYLKRVFLNPCVVRKRWLHKDKKEFLPIELYETLYIRENEVQKF